MTPQEALQTLGLSALPATRDALRAALERKLAGARALLARSAASVNRDQIFQRMAACGEAYAALEPLVPGQQAPQPPTAQPSPHPPVQRQPPTAPVASPRTRQRQAVGPQRVPAPMPPVSSARPIPQATQAPSPAQTQPVTPPASSAPRRSVTQSQPVAQPPYQPPYANWARAARHWWNRFWQSRGNRHRYAAIGVAILILFLLSRGLARPDKEPARYVFMTEPMQSVQAEPHATPQPLREVPLGQPAGTVTIPFAPSDPELPVRTILLPEPMDNLVWILCHPVADVYIDGAYAGESPRPKPFLISAGSHAVQVIPKGEVSARRFDVSLSTGKPYVIHVLLDEDQVSIHEGVFPCDAAR
ncbi:MAG: hypothetical protein HUU46_19180 [Candidatus Hydrogenedentes bacterium]|nr:hypothetical protein [Candidatus Hydrogenedentota bacterium]